MSTAVPQVATASPRVFTWEREKEKGQGGATRLVAHLRRLGKSVVDLSDVMDAQRRDIDLIVDGQMVEVKSDFHRPVNVFLEVTCDAKPGNVFKSRADYWLVYFPLHEKCYRFDSSKLQWWLGRHLSEYPLVEIRNSRRGDNLWFSYGIAVPIARLIDEGIGEEVVLGDE